MRRVPLPRHSMSQPILLVALSWHGTLMLVTSKSIRPPTNGSLPVHPSLHPHWKCQTLPLRRSHSGMTHVRTSPFITKLNSNSISATHAEPKQGFIANFQANMKTCYSTTIPIMTTGKRSCSPAHSKHIAKDSSNAPS